MAKANPMHRSQNQIAMSYAPGSFFTFEGGMGGCVACSTMGEHVDLSGPTLDQIFERMTELGSAWYDAAVRARDNDAVLPPVKPTQCVDPALLDHTRSRFQLPGQHRFYLCRPSEMAFTPAPLAFVCRKCGLFRQFDSLKSANDALPALREHACRDGGICDWQQLDVVFVHWSGTWLAPFPGQWHWSQDEQKAVRREGVCECGSREFRLNRKASGVGDWFFQCASATCGRTLSNKWLQNDPATLQIIGPEFTDPKRLTEVRMQAAPYRASAVYYVKQDLFIDFKDAGSDLLKRLQPSRVDALKEFIADRYGLGVTPITDEQVLEACGSRADCLKERLAFQEAIDTIAGLEPLLRERRVEALQKALNTALTSKSMVVDDLRRRSILVPQVDFPIALEEQLRHRQARFASKFDPFRLSVEHATLAETRLAVNRREDGKKPFVSFAELDEDLSPEEPSDKTALETAAARAMEQLGIAQMGLIRQFDLCRFSFGYSRMESGPVLEKRDHNMPVRLNLFGTVRHDQSQKHPIYVVQQGNEALYVRLKPELVLEWLQGLACPDMFTLSGNERIGAGILSVAQPMGPFLDKLPQTDQPPVYFYLYTLLHSYAHLLMTHVSEYSGLDQGSLGEYIFPADLAFVVYRNGTTMDLGNLSAMWRNAGVPMLQTLLQPKSTQCGTGSLCAERGSACPDCIMVPETSCIASNKLLSRAVLRHTGRRPRFDQRMGPISGYLDLALQKWPPSQP